jgi:hypothetical protein
VVSSCPGPPGGVRDRVVLGRWNLFALDSLPRSLVVDSLPPLDQVVECLLGTQYSLAPTHSLGMVAPPGVDWSCLEPLVVCRGTTSVVQSWLRGWSCLEPPRVVARRRCSERGEVVFSPSGLVGCLGLLIVGRGTRGVLSLSGVVVRAKSSSASGPVTETKQLRVAQKESREWSCLELPEVVSGHPGPGQR